MKIGIFGGTFNPIHSGHLNIIKILKEKYNFDEIWIVPTFRTPQKDFFPEKITNKDRINTIQAAIEEKGYEKWVKIDNYELQNRGISYTYTTIKHFIEKYPDHVFVLIMGDDRYNHFDSWRNAGKIRKMVPIYVYKRNGLPRYLITKRITYIQDIVYDVSSSEIIRKLEWNLIPIQSRKYIAKKFLYLKSIVFYKLYDSKRFEHSLAVASHAKRLAIANNYHSPEFAYIAGLTHDLFKYDNDASLLKYLSKNSNWKIPLVPALHGYVAALWLEKEYLLEEKEILNAIKKHTIPDNNMSLLDKIVFVADKISPECPNNLALRMRKLAYSNLDETFAKILKDQYRKLLISGEKIDENFELAYETYVLKKFSKKELKKERKRSEKFKRIN